MFEPRQIERDESPDEWAVRSEFWIAESAKAERKRLTRERNSNSLILTGHGTTLRIESGALAIRGGFSHYPQQRECHRFFRGDLRIPRVIILLDGSGSLSFDVLDWLGAQGVALARIKWDGDICIMASGAGFAANPEKLRWQYQVQSDDRQRLEFASQLIARKLRNSVDTLQSQFPASRRGAIAVDKATKGEARLTGEQFVDMAAIRGIEADCAAAYFSAWTDIAMEWTAQGRYPVPDEWLVFRSRSSTLTGSKAKNWKASHPVNAMLNYAYAVKAAQLQIQAVSDGFDPYAGIMHHSRHGFPAYVYDLIEPERPKVDATILTFAQSRKFSGADFILRKDGVCRLSPQLAKAVAGLVTG